MIKRTMLTAMAFVLGTGTLGFAADSDVQTRLQAMEAQIKAQQAEIQTLRSGASDTWLNERRADEVKALVREVLADADTRASLAEGGATAGRKNGHFFIASEDGNFLLNVWGLAQFRYVYQHTNQSTETHNNQEEDIRSNTRKNNFHMARTEIGFTGHIYDPKITYAIDFIFSDSEDNALAVEFSEGGAAFLQNSWIAYDFADGWNVKAGQFKTPFLREDMVGDGNGIAVERSLLSANFGAGYTQGIQFTYAADMWRAWAAVHDGANRPNTNFQSDSIEIATTARVEVLLAGKWNQFDDNVAWSGSGTGILLGAAVQYDNAKHDSASDNGDTTGSDDLRWTADVTAKLPELMGLSLYGAIIGSHPQANELGTSGGGADQFGILAQASFFIIPDKMDIFGRWEYFDLNDNVQNSTTVLGDEHDTTNIVTVGTNYYFHKHNLKATFDLLWVIDRDPGLNGNGGISNDNVGMLGGPDFNNRNEFVARAQIQFAF